MAKLKRDRNAQAELTGSTDHLARRFAPQLAPRSLCARRLNGSLSVELLSGTHFGERPESAHLARSHAPGEGPLTEPRAGAQFGGGNFLHCLFVILDALDDSGYRGRGDRPVRNYVAFWPGIRAGYWGRSSVTVNHGALSAIKACASGRSPESSSSVASATP